jgi:hypothetical protein
MGTDVYVLVNLVTFSIAPWGLARSVGVVAILYEATLSPSKLELLQAWLPSQPWFVSAGSTRVESVGSYRFDDPEGEVGIETHLVRTDEGRTYQVPVTYRGNPLSGAESFLISSAQHSVLGERWVYDATGDITYVRALADIVFLGGHEATVDVLTANGPVRYETTTKVVGSGSLSNGVHVDELLSVGNDNASTWILTADLKIVIPRVIEDILAHEDEFSLRGTWPGQSEPILLASIQRL